MIHFNTAGAGLVESTVLDTMKDYLDLEAEIGSYEAEVRHDDVLSTGIYKRLAGMFNGCADNFALFDSSTRAWATVLNALRIRPSSEIWVTPYEYAGFLVTLHNLSRQCGARIRFVPLDAGGDIDLQWMADNVGNHVSVVSVPHVPSGCGIVNPVETIGGILAGFDTYYFVDACQSVGQLDVDCSRIRADLTTGAGRKFICGPRGTGFLHISDRLLDAVHLLSPDLHACDFDSNLSPFYTIDSARRLELSERSNAAFLGFDEALRLLRKREAGLKRPCEAFVALKEEVSDLKDCAVITPGAMNSGILSFRHRKHRAAFVVDHLSDLGFNVWKIQGSHTPKYMCDEGVDEAVRISVSHRNTMAECEGLASAIRDMNS